MSVYVFGYGALMIEAQGKVGRPARLAGYELGFTLPGAPPFEPSFAAIVEKEGGIVYGVVAEYADEDWQVRRASESNYREVRATVELLEGGTTEAIVLVPPSALLVPERVPSHRYARLLREGAEWHKFPEEVLDRYRRAEEAGSKLSWRLRWLRGIVAWQTARIGFRPAVVVTLLGCIGILAGGVWLLLYLVVSLSGA